MSVKGMCTMYVLIFANLSSPEALGLYLDCEEGMCVPTAADLERFCIFLCDSMPESFIILG